MLTLRKMLRETSTERMSKGDLMSSVRIIDTRGGGKEFIKTKEGRDFDKAAPSTFLFEITSNSSRKYRTIINFTEKASMDDPVKVRCTCPDFRYRTAAVFHRHGSLYGNVDAIIQTKMPNETNPDYSPYLCKHLVASAKGLNGAGLLG